MDKKVLRNKKNLKTVLAIFVLLLPFIFVFILDYFTLPEFDESLETVAVLIPKGASISAIADTLLDKDLIQDKELFILWLTTLAKDRALKAGYYEIPRGLNYAQIISFLSLAQAKEVRVTLIEGWQIEQIANELAIKLNINSEKFITLAHDTVLIKNFNIKASSLEGYLLPDTYYFYWGLTEEELLKFLTNKCLTIFTDSINSKLDSMNLNIHQILTLASIIEGEAIFDDERRIISSVYHNRLKRRIKLQADPTIQYILKGPPKRLLYQDLEIDSQYNTYKYYGLPPGPINNPGKKSILAAINPAKTKFLYFVARGDGRHTFTQTAAEHAREKAKFDKIRREVYRKSKSSN